MKVFRGSVSALALLLLILMIFFGGNPANQWMYIAAFIAWALVLLCTWVASQRKRIAKVLHKIIRPLSSRKMTGRRPMPARTEPTLTGHLRCRITDQLRTVFEDAAWQWADDRQEKRVIRGKPGRIITENTGVYRQAEVSVDESCSIRIHMMQDLAVPDKSDSGSSASTGSHNNPEAWLQAYGEAELQKYKNSMSPFGFQQFSVSDTGEVFVEAGDAQISKGTLRDFPPVLLWPALADCLAKSDFRPHVEGNRFVVAW